MTEKFVPVDGLILIKELTPREALEFNGLVRSDELYKISRIGMVEAIGGTTISSVKEGLMVLFYKDSGTVIKLGGKEYLTMNEEDILQVYQPLPPE